MMKKTFFFPLLIGLTCCDTISSNQNTLSEFNFPSKLPAVLSENSAFAFAFSEADTLNIGDTYKAKVFLANRSYVYDGDSIEPVIKYYFGDSTSMREIWKSSIPVEVVNDTGYVKFIVQDNELKRGQTKKTNWYASITIPRQPIDTVFTLVYEFIIQKK